jgi:glycosyltransferase involved in cell wall biosynthesis
VFYENTIVTIHDLSVFMFPKAYSRKFYLTYKYLLPLIIKRSKKVITVSEGAKAKIVEILKVPEKKIDVVHNAASHLSRQDTSHTSALVSGRYILTVASFNPIKNLDTLMRAFAGIDDKTIKLVIVGARQKAFSNQQFDKNMAGNDRIIFTGHIHDQAQLMSLYKNATVFVFPSLYESFGIPTLEAMTCGCPVITSDAGSLREICGDAALYVDPYKTESITGKLNILLNDRQMQQQLIERGYERIKRYNWKESAKKVVNVIESVT